MYDSPALLIREELSRTSMWLAWIVAIGIVVASVVLLMHLGVNVLGSLSSAFHDAEHFLGRSL